MLFGRWRSIWVVRHVARAFLTKDISADGGRDLRFESERKREGEDAPVSASANYTAWRYSMLVTILMLLASSVIVEFTDSLAKGVPRISIIFGTDDAPAINCANLDEPSPGFDVSQTFMPFLRRTGSGECGPSCERALSDLRSSLPSVQLPSATTTPSSDQCELAQTSSAQVYADVLNSTGSEQAAELAANSTRDAVAQGCADAQSSAQQEAAALLALGDDELSAVRTRLLDGSSDDDGSFSAQCEAACARTLGALTGAMCANDIADNAPKDASLEQLLALYATRPVLRTVCGELRVHSASRAGDCLLSRWRQITGLTTSAFKTSALVLVALAFSSVRIWLASQRFILAAFTANALGPVVATAVPWFDTLGFAPAMDAELQDSLTKGLLSQRYRMAIASESMVEVLPILLAVIPAAIRAAQLWKTVVPDSSLWGWVAWVAPLIQFAVVYGALVFPLHVVGDGWFGGCNAFYSTTLLGFMLIAHTVNAHREPGALAASKAFKNASYFKMGWLCLAGACCGVWAYNFALGLVLERFAALPEDTKLALAERVETSIQERIRQYVRTQWAAIVALGLNMVSATLLNQLSCADGLANLLVELRTVDGYLGEDGEDEDEAERGIESIHAMVEDNRETLAERRAARRAKARDALARAKAHHKAARASPPSKVSLGVRLPAGKRGVPSQ